MKPKIILLEVFAIICIIKVTGVFGLYIPVTGLFRLGASMFIIAYISDIIKYQTRLTAIYILLMFLGFILHMDMSQIDNPFWEMVAWVAPICLLVVGYKSKYNLKLLWVFCFFIFTSVCCVNIYEKITETHLIDFSNSEILEEFDKLGDSDPSMFRAFGLIGHPLNNANTLSIILAFIVASNFTKTIKVICLSIGLIALWCVNSRAGMLIWVINILFILFLKDRKWYIGLLGIIVLMVILPPAIEYINETELLGRLDFDFSDDSSAARIQSFGYFFMRYWSLDEILMGGNFLTIPGSPLLLENGLLLNMGYWGWIIGFLKFALEIFISFQFLKDYSTSNKLIILLSTWGVAIMNNNNFLPVILYYFVVFFICFNSINRALKRGTTTLNVQKIPQ